MGIISAMFYQEDEVNNLKNKNVLIFSFSNDYQHESREHATIALTKQIEEYGGSVISTDDSSYFRKENLDNIDVVVFLNTGGNIFSEAEQQSFIDFIRSGGGFVGIHGAAATEYDWKWYGRLLGAFFDNHPKIQKATLYVEDTSHISTLHLPLSYEWNDEWYNWKELPGDDINILLTVDESTYSGGKHKDHHPISWYHKFDGGRSWYTALGHKSEHYDDTGFLKHIIGGIIWVSKND
ncbi:MAG: ThuA domain-containing protein [Melioribacteraceae bacterium]|nr:ThuA domain-containing protein [Melioribacteraceae bacterium]